MAAEHNIQQDLRERGGHSVTGRCGEGLMRKVVFCSILLDSRILYSLKRMDFHFGDFIVL